MIVTAGATNKSVYFYIVGDASHASPGDPITGLLFSDIETGGSASYNRQGAARVDLKLITLASASAAHADGGFILVDDTNMPGVYRCDYPDAAWATGVDQTICHLVAASANNAAIAPILVDISDFDIRDSVRGGLTALPNAAADAAGGLPISDAGGLDMDALNTAAVRLTAARAQAIDDWINGGRLDLILDIIAADTTTDIPALITALNDVAATDIVSAGAITTLAGAVVNVDLVDTTTANTDMRGTDSAATAAALATAQADLDTITGLDGATLATAQALYAPAKAGDNMGSVSSVTGNVAGNVIGSAGSVLGGINTTAGTITTLDALDTAQDTQHAATRAVVDDLGVKKNATFSNFEFLMVLTSDHVTPATGLTVTGQRSIDGAAFASVSGAIAEVSNGIYQFDALAADTNGDVITWRFSSGTADDTFVTFKTVT